MVKETIVLISQGDELQANLEYYLYILPSFNNEIDINLVAKENN